MIMAPIPILLATLIGGFAWLVAISPGRPEPLRDATGQIVPGSVSERVAAAIGGLPQGTIIQGVDPANPVPLFLRGGSGMTEFPMEPDHPTGLDRHFPPVWRERRGAGMSLAPDIPLENMTMEQMIADTIEVADSLRDRFDQDRIPPSGHSRGSYLGIQVAAAAPDRFRAHVGMAQIVRQLRFEVMAHAFLLETCRALGEMAMLDRPESAPVTPEDGQSPERLRLRLRDTAMHRAGVGHARDIASVVTGIFLPVWRVRAYTLVDEVDVWCGKLWSRPFFWEDLLRDDLSARLTRFGLPVHFFVGHYDRTARPDLARAHVDAIDAPVKGFHLFANSARSPLFQGPGRATEILPNDVPQEKP
jgi:pimeloyl-ACP methyl ester carboxylesterase